MKIENDKFAYYIENVGDMVSNSIPIILAEKLPEGILEQEKYFTCQLRYMRFQKY